MWRENIEGGFAFCPSPFWAQSGHRGDLGEPQVHCPMPCEVPTVATLMSLGGRGQ